MSQSDYHQAKYVLPPFRILWGRPSRLTDSLGNAKVLNHADTGTTFFAYTLQATPANGDRMYTYLYTGTGTETKLSISTFSDTAGGIWDLYVNGVLDSSGYDEYLAAQAITDRSITLANALKVGENEIQIRVNGKNAASTNYYIQVFGISLS